MYDILIVGAGAMGTAFCFPLADAGNRVTLVGTHLDGEWVKHIQEKDVHPKLKTPIPETVTALFYEDLEAALTPDIGLIVLGVSSAGVNWALDQLGPLLKRPISILMLTKGLTVEDGGLRILPEKVRRELSRYGFEQTPVGAVAGPCIAAELAARRDSSVVFACDDGEINRQWIQMASTPYYHIRASMDVIGIEFCAALKNFYTLAIGAPPGQLEKRERIQTIPQVHNMAAALFTQALEEMTYIVTHMGGDVASVYGLAGSGDLYVTCQAGRNSRMGRLLGTGLTYTEAKSQHMAQDTVEGAELAIAIGPALERLMSQGRLGHHSLPLAQAIIDAICRDAPLRLIWKDFFLVQNKY
ncbi:MAG: 2-dehydropantoate 2-reductase N-terminal domain-containing protein [Deltaproteobacteria bacterium]|nr:2-dehydropantoate 2-reductase N-terminal domain-containing protein [Deltaproteobacteria bacterium]